MNKRESLHRSRPPPSLPPPPPASVFVRLLLPLPPYSSASSSCLRARPPPPPPPASFLLPRSPSQLCAPRFSTLYRTQFTINKFQGGEKRFWEILLISLFSFFTLSLSPPLPAFLYCLVLLHSYSSHSLYILSLFMFFTSSLPSIPFTLSLPSILLLPPPISFF